MSPVQRIAVYPQLLAHKQSHVQPTEAWEDDDVYIFSSCSSCVLSKAYRSQKKAVRDHGQCMKKEWLEDFSIPHNVNWILTLILQTLRESRWAFLSNPVLDTLPCTILCQDTLDKRKSRLLRQLSPAFSPSLQCQVWE